MNYTLISNEMVFTNIQKGYKVRCCDFKTNKILDCDALTVATIRTLMTSPDAVFFKVSEE